MACQDCGQIMYGALCEPCARYRRRRVFDGPKMMPGQDPYTQDELRKLYKLVREAADGDPGEERED